MPVSFLTEIITKELTYGNGNSPDRIATLRSRGYDKMTEWKDSGEIFPGADLTKCVETEYEIIRISVFFPPGEKTQRIDGIGNPGSFYFYLRNRKARIRRHRQAHHFEPVLSRSGG